MVFLNLDQIAPILKRYGCYDEVLSAAMGITPARRVSDRLPRETPKTPLRSSAKPPVRPPQRTSPTRPNFAPFRYRLIVRGIRKWPDLTPGQYDTARALHRISAPQTVREVADRAKHPAPTVQQFLRQLMALKLVTRART